MVHIRRSVNGRLISIVALTVLLVSCSPSVNERVRHGVAADVNGDRAQTGWLAPPPTFNISPASSSSAARDQTIEHAALAIFVVAAGDAHHLHAANLRCR